jgi:hypothetical protein
MGKTVREGKELWEGRVEAAIVEAVIVEAVIVIVEAVIVALHRESKREGEAGQGARSKQPVLRYTTSRQTDRGCATVSTERLGIQ